MVIEGSIFWNIPHGQLKVNRRFGGASHLHPQGREMNQLASKALDVFLIGLFLDFEYLGDIFSETSVDF
jgi:hypothetical protein